jgi:hypothetical protein
MAESITAPVRPTPAVGPAFPLLRDWFGLLAAGRPAFRQERTGQRATGLAVGWLLTLGRHTLTRSLAALGLTEDDWTAFHRLFARPRFAPDDLSRQLLRATLAEVPVERPYLVAVDATTLPRHSRTMPGTGWVRAPGTAPFCRGLARGQRFVDCCWLPGPSPAGYSRAVPLRWVPAFTPKAVPADGYPPCKEWEAGPAQLGWARAELDAAGRTAQPVLGLADATYASVKVWKGLPDRVGLLARCQKNRALFALPAPPPPGQRGRKRLYGAQAPHPAEWLTEPAGWQTASFAVRGRTVRPTFRVEGPYRLKGAADHPVFLLVVKGVDRHGRKVRREPTYWLVSAEATEEGGWRLPYPAADLLAWAWQRWEIEVAHREQKTTFGLGDPQGWTAASTVTSVQWAGWLYGTLLLTGLRVWGPERPPAGTPTTRWWRGGGRWSPAQLWAAVRAELWDLGEFRPVWHRTPFGWPEFTDWAAAQTNALLSASQT